jgi:hypothetical protein
LFHINLCKQRLVGKIHPSHTIMRNQIYLTCSQADGELEYYRTLPNPRKADLQPWRTRAKLGLYRKGRGKGVEEQSSHALTCRPAEAATEMTCGLRTEGTRETLSEVQGL